MLLTSGAMENKSLNVFNSKCILASPATATDYDYFNVMRVIGHEYFHNYTGNRVTCRDWFQLTLKEGLTVCREQVRKGTKPLSVVSVVSTDKLLHWCLAQALAANTKLHFSFREN